MYGLTHRACPGIEPGPGTPHYHLPGLIPYGVSVSHSSIELTRVRNHPDFTISQGNYSSEHFAAVNRNVR